MEVCRTTFTDPRSLAQAMIVVRHGKRRSGKTGYQVASYFPAGMAGDPRGVVPDECDYTDTIEQARTAWKRQAAAIKRWGFQKEAN